MDATIPHSALKKLSVSPKMFEILRDVWVDRLSPGGIAFTYLASRTFDVTRYPTRPDRSVDGIGGAQFDNAVRYLDSIAEAEWHLLELELLELQSRTQEVLRATFGERVPLKRAIGALNEGPANYTYAAREVDEVLHAPMLAMAAKAAGRHSISFDVDIVSGWSRHVTERYGSLHISRTWPISDVILVSDLLASPGGGIGPLESDEWLCLNRNRTGLMEFPTSDLGISRLPQSLVAKASEAAHAGEILEAWEGRAKNQSARRRIAPQIEPRVRASRARRTLLARTLDWANGRLFRCRR